MGAVVGVTSLIVIPLAAAGPAAAAGAACTPDAGYTSCVRYAYTGADDSFTVPAGVTSLKAKIWGAGGGGVEPNPDDEQAGGGSGGFTTATLAVTPSSTLRIVVGEGGHARGSTPTYGGGGVAGDNGESFFKGGSGGGLTGLFSAASAPLLIAGGGGGGGGVAFGGGNFNGQQQTGGGGGGGLAGTDATTSVYMGLPGTQLTGGAAAAAPLEQNCLTTPTAGVHYVGGNGGSGVVNSDETAGGGGGGGGYFGGGGGACAYRDYMQPSNDDAGAGGGGSGYVGGVGVSDADIFAGTAAYGIFNNADAAGSSDPLYDAGIGQGGSDADGGNGEIVLEWVDGPTASAVTSTGIGTATQSPTITVPDGGSLRLLNALSVPVTSLVVADEGTYTVDTTTNVISFVPVFPFHGTATPVNYRVTDSSSRTADATYTPTVTVPAAPLPTALTSNGTGMAGQSVHVVVPNGGSVTLLDGSTAVTSITVPNEGGYTLNPATGAIFFAPAAGFSGTGNGVTYQVTDAYGSTGSSTYIPFSARVVVPTEVVATATAPTLMKVVTQSQTMPVVCKLTVRKVGHCDVTLVYRNTKGTFVVGTGSVSSPQAGGTVGQLTNNVTLNAAGHYLAGLGIIPTWVYVGVTPYGSRTARSAITRTAFVNYNLK
jgi:CshA-type fibril repeat protein